MQVTAELYLCQMNKAEKSDLTEGCTVRIKGDDIVVDYLLDVEHRDTFGSDEGTYVVKFMGHRRTAWESDFNRGKAYAEDLPEGEVI